MADPTPTQSAPFNRGNALDDLVILADVVKSLQGNGILVLGADGHYAFSDPTTGEIVQEVGAIEAILKAHAVTVPQNVDRIIAALPLILPLLGVN